eukprot:UN15368
MHFKSPDKVTQVHKFNKWFSNLECSQNGKYFATTYLDQLYIFNFDDYTDGSLVTRKFQHNISSITFVTASDDLLDSESPFFC